VTSNTEPDLKGFDMSIASITTESTAAAAEATAATATKMRRFVR
jgi:hypothetical protein